MAGQFPGVLATEAGTPRSAGCFSEPLSLCGIRGKKKKHTKNQRAVILETNTSLHLAPAGSPAAKSGVWALAVGGGGTREGPHTGPPSWATHTETRARGVGTQTCTAHTHVRARPRTHPASPELESHVRTPLATPKSSLPLPAGEAGPCDVAASGRAAAAAAIPARPRRAPRSPCLSRTANPAEAAWGFRAPAEITAFWHRKRPAYEKKKEEIWVLWENSSGWLSSTI